MMEIQSSGMRGEFCFLHEKESELLWVEQKGISPDTGEMWLTPRIERLALEPQAWEKS